MNEVLTPDPTCTTAGSTPAVPAAAVTANPRPSLILILAAFLAVYLIWGSTYLAILFAVETLPPFLMAGIRHLVAGVILFPIVRRRFPGPLTARHWYGAALVGTLMLLGGNGLVCWSEQHIPSGVAALLVATVPLWLIGLDWLFFRGPRPSPMIVIGIIVGLAGVYLLINPAGLHGEQLHLPSAVAMLAACAFWAFGSLYSRRGDMPPDVFLSISMQMLSGGLTLILCSLLTGEFTRINLDAMSAKSILSLIYLIIFGSLIAFTAYIWLLKHCTSAQVSTYAFVNPVVAVALGAAFAAESFTSRHALASAAIIGSVVLITLTAKRRIRAT